MYTSPIFLLLAQIPFALCLLSNNYCYSLYSSLSFKSPMPMPISSEPSSVCGDVLVGHSNAYLSSFLLLFIAQRRMQPPAKDVTVNTMGCRSYFRPIKWLAYPWFQATKNNSWKRTQTTFLFTSILLIFIFLLGFFVFFFSFHVLDWLKIDLLKCNIIVCACKRMKLHSKKPCPSTVKWVKHPDNEGWRFSLQEDWEIWKTICT